MWGSLFWSTGPAPSFPSNGEDDTKIGHWEQFAQEWEFWNFEFRDSRTLEAAPWCPTTCRDAGIPGPVRGSRPPYFDGSGCNYSNSKSRGDVVGPWGRL